MNLRTSAVLSAGTVLVALATSVGPLQAGSADVPRVANEELVSTFTDVSRSTSWTQTRTIDLDFETYHPQAMEVVGNRIFLSSVEIIKAPRKYAQPVNGYDRTPGKGVGHLFVLDRDGQLLEDITIADGHRYHPGGLDYDGRYLWLPVAEYRPDSSADIYRIDPRTSAVKKLFRVDDHVGGVVRDRVTGHLIGQSWGSRRFYDWTVTGEQKRFWLNENHFIDYQDCEYVAYRKALCSGVAELAPQPGVEIPYELGGFAMVGLRNPHRVLHAVPLQLWSAAGHVITRNPTDIDADGRHLTLYAAPDDSDEAAGTQVLVYEADVTPLR